MAAHFPATRQLGLDRVHYTWAGTFVLEAAVFLFPDLNFILCDADCIPLALYEVAELANLAAAMFPERRQDPSRGVVLLVSEPHAEINAGWVCVGARQLPRPDFGRDYQEATSSHQGGDLLSDPSVQKMHRRLHSQVYLSHPCWVVKQKTH